MGGGSFDRDVYTSSRVTRSSKGIDDFAYSKVATTIHDSLDPKRISTKVMKKLESRDSKEHPESTPIMVVFDVTGSNVSRARDAQAKLPNLMDLLTKYVPNPQISIGANDDYKVSGRNAFQMSEFESDNRIDEHLRNVFLVSHGGSNDGESYDLALYAAARKTVTDSWEKRKKKGYLFLYADEPLFLEVDKNEVEDVFGDKLESNIPIKAIIKEVQQRWNVFVLWPLGGYAHARDQYVDLFGKESVLTLQQPKLICELIAATVGMNEEQLSDEQAEKDLQATGLSSAEAKKIVNDVSKTKPVAAPKASSKEKAARL